MAEVVSVGCKLPHGLILELPGKAPVVIAGANKASIAGGHGITEGVDKAFFDAWIKQYAWLPAVKGNHIFAHAKVNDVRAEAEEMREEKTGFEGLDPNALPAGLTAADGA